VTPRERFLAALNNQVPDRVPAAPDISTYIPIKRTGLPFWEICLKETIPLWQAYLDAADYFGIDAWFAPSAGSPFRFDGQQTERRSRLGFIRGRDAMVQRTVVDTPDGPLTQQVFCYRSEPPTITEKLIKHVQADFKRFKWLALAPAGLDPEALETMRSACQKRQLAFGFSVGYPGFHSWNTYVQGGIEALTYAEVDSPEVLEEWAELDMERGTREMELLLEARLDYILLGGSGTITLASPQLARKYALPALKKWSRMAKEAGVPTMLHSCGKNRVLADMLAEETDVGMINPLEPAPMGDIDLAELKRAHGGRLSLMGNLHTTEVMLRGSPQLVTKRAIEAMRDAGRGGGFILSTGDQCGRETPDQNLFALVEAAKEYGRYDQATGTLPDLPSSP
jgi:uroporphyrinogen decarboxylase